MLFSESILPVKTSEKRVRQGACGRFEGVYKDVHDRKHL